MSDGIEPPDEHLAAYFAAEAEAHVPDPAAQARVWARLEATVLGPPSPPPVDAPTEPPTDATAPSTAADLVKRGLLTALVALLGAGAGIGVDRAFFRPEPQVVRVEVPVPAEPVVAPPPPAPEPEPPPPASTPEAPETIEAPAPRRRSAPPSRPDLEDEERRRSELSRERQMLDAIRAAVARGHTDEALATVARHEREFPTGHLVEEREGLRILALARAGRLGEARRRADAFEARFPRSVLRESIRAALSP